MVVLVCPHAPAVSLSLSHRSPPPVHLPDRFLGSNSSIKALLLPALTACPTGKATSCAPYTWQPSVMPERDHQSTSAACPGVRAHPSKGTYLLL